MSTVDLPLPEEEGNEEMTTPIDLPANVAAQLQLESVGNIQSTNQDSRNVSSIAMGALQALVARESGEVGAIESVSTKKVLESKDT